ncbi:MAG: glycosyltransferase [Methyloceanibacter sp.]
MLMDNAPVPLAPTVGRPVALFFHRLGTRGGGAQYIVCALANALCERGFAVHVITWDEPEARAFYALDPRVIWSRLGFRPGATDKVRRMRALARLLVENGVRVLVGFVMAPEKTVFAAAKLAGVRLIAAERNAPSMYSLRYGFARRWLSFGMLHLADCIAVQMPDFTAGYPASLRNRIEVIPNPVPIAKRRARPDWVGLDGRFKLLAVGRLDLAQKRHDCLVGAFAKVASDHPAWDLYILGDGPNLQALRRLAGEKGVVERMHFLPWTSDISEVYASSHLFVMPSLWEGFPNALAEAMSHGLPAIGFREAAGVAQLIDNGETGWLADGLNDEVNLARVLFAAMADREQRARRGARAAESMAVYAPETQFDSWARLIGTLMDGKGRPSYLSSLAWKMNHPSDVTWF